MVPTVDIELVWQTHMSQPKKYDRYCRVLTSGRRIRHSYRSPWYYTTLPTSNITSSSSKVVKKIYSKTCELWSQRFHESYANLPPDRQQRSFPWRLSKLLWSKLLTWTTTGRIARKRCKKEMEVVVVVAIGCPVHTAIFASGGCDVSASANPTDLPAAVPSSVETLVALTYPSSPTTTTPACWRKTVDVTTTAPCTPDHDDDDNDDGNDDDDDVVKGDQIEIHLQGRLAEEDDSDRWRRA